MLLLASQSACGALCYSSWTCPISIYGQREAVLSPYAQLHELSWLLCRPAEGSCIDTHHKKALKMICDAHFGDLHLMKTLLLPGPLLIAATLLEFPQKLVTVQLCKTFCKH